jgi:hypothetical protein
MNAQDKKRKFLNDKIREMLKTFLGSGLDIQSLYDVLNNNTIKIDGLTVSKEKSQQYQYKIVNAANNGCELIFEGGRHARLHIYFRIQDVSVTWRFIESSRCDFILYFLEQLPSIEKEFIEFAQNVDKQVKIADISKNSIITWLKTLCKDIHQPYDSTVDEHKVTLSVKMKYSTQLDIPIYYKNFQKIMPEILNTIQQYEEVLNKTKIKINISNNRVGQRWLNNK